MYDVDCRLHRGEVEEQERTVATRSIPSRASSISPRPTAAPAGGLTFSSAPVLEIISFCCFYIAVFYFFAVVQTRHFFLMLKLLLVFCGGCSALSFLLSRTSLFRREIWVHVWEGDSQTRELTRDKSEESDTVTISLHG